jgi:hypothetical protein
MDGPLVPSRFPSGCWGSWSAWPGSPTIGAEVSMRKLSKPEVGRHSEAVVRLQLVDRGWLVQDLNLSVPNTPGFDLFAVKAGAKPALIRVKGHDPDEPGAEIKFLFNVSKVVPLNLDDVAHDIDFTVLVVVGYDAGDSFYILPTSVVRQEMIARHEHYYGRLNSRTGAPKVHNGTLTLYFGPALKDQDRPGHDLARRWAKYRDAWDLLDQKVT